MQTDYDRIETAIRYLEAHVTAQPHLAEIAAQTHLSPYHFERLFKRWAGVTPKQFLQYLTLDHAKANLHRAASVLEASYATGLSGGGRLHDLFVTLEAVTPGTYRTGGAGLTIRYGVHDSPFGPCLIGRTDRGICHLSFAGPDGDAALEALANAWPDASLIEAPDTTAAVAARIAGNPSSDAPITLAPRGTNFQIQVWQALLRIPPGRVVAYEDLARALGRPEATRAVSSAVARNPIGYLIPCHRVIRKTGHFGQYRWGSTRKRAMIAREAALTAL